MNDSELAHLQESSGVEFENIPNLLTIEQVVAYSLNTLQTCTP